MTVTNLKHEIEAEKHKAVDSEDRQERGMVLVVTGWLFILFGIMVALFFHPSSPKFGNVNIRNLALLLMVIGVVLKIWGGRVRRSAP